MTEHLDGKLGVIHFDRHVDTQKTDLDERMHTTPMANAAATILGVDADELAGLGYRQELHRSLGAFAGFAAGFSFVSTLTTTFQLFALGFFFGGPAFVWNWPIVFVGQMAVALVFAELCRAGSRSRGRSTSGRGGSAARSWAGSPART